MSEGEVGEENNYNNTSSISGRKDSSEKVWYGNFPVFTNGSKQKAKACVSLMKRKNLQLFFYVNFYSKGYYPYLKEADRYEGYTIRVPLPVIVDITREILLKGASLQKNASHKWIKKRYKKDGVKAGTN